MLQTIAVISSVVALDVIRYPQKMRVVNSVWILTPLYSSVLGLSACHELGRLKTK